MATLHGKNASVTIGGTVVCATNWSVNFVSDLADATTTCSAGFRDYVAGLKGATVNVDFVYDGTNHPDAGSFAGVEPGATINLKILETAGGTTLFHAPTFIVDNITVNGPVGDIMTFSLSGSATGTFDWDNA